MGLWNDLGPVVRGAWIGGGDVNSVFYAIADGTGQYRLAPTEATVGSAGTYSKLQARALPGGPRAALVAQYNSSTNSSLKATPIPRCKRSVARRSWSTHSASSVER